MTLEEAIIHAKEVAEECETDRDCAYQHDKLTDWLEELKKYKDLEAKGRIIVFPCKLGDTVWSNKTISGCYLRKKDRPYKAKVVFIGISNLEKPCDGFFTAKFLERDLAMQFNFSEIGKTVFLTKEEAEAALKMIEDERITE